MCFKINITDLFIFSYIPLSMQFLFLPNTKIKLQFFFFLSPRNILWGINENVIFSLHNLVVSFTFYVLWKFVSHLIYFMVTRCPMGFIHCPIYLFYRGLFLKSNCLIVTKYSRGHGLSTLNKLLVILVHRMKILLCIWYVVLCHYVFKPF